VGMRIGAGEPYATGGREAARRKSRQSRLRRRLMSAATSERDDAFGASLYHRRDPFRRSVRDGAQRVVRQMGVALGGSGLTMAEHLANEIEAVAAGYGDRGEAVPKVMNADIVEPGHPADALPGHLNSDEMSFTAFSGQNVWAAHPVAACVASSRSLCAPSGTVLAPVIVIAEARHPLVVDPTPAIRDQGAVSPVSSRAPDGIVSWPPGRRRT
jgi:hypothetical protein